MINHLISCKQPKRGGGTVERLAITKGTLQFGTHELVLAELCHNGRQLGICPQSITWAMPLPEQEGSHV